MPRNRKITGHGLKLIIFLDGIKKQSEDYSAALQLNPDLAFCYSNRGVARSQSNDLDGAVKDLTHAISLHSTTSLMPISIEDWYTSIKGSAERG